MDNVIDDLKKNLICNNNMEIVVLELHNKFFNKPYVSDVIDCLERKLSNVSVGLDDISPLEKLAITLLLDSANIDLKDYKVGE